MKRKFLFPTTKKTDKSVSVCHVYFFVFKMNSQAKDTILDFNSVKKRRFNCSRVSYISCNCLFRVKSSIVNGYECKIKKGLKTI